MILALCQRPPPKSLGDGLVREGGGKAEGRRRDWAKAGVYPSLIGNPTSVLYRRRLSRRVHEQLATSVAIFAEVLILLAAESWLGPGLPNPNRRKLTSFAEAMNFINNGGPVYARQSAMLDEENSYIRIVIHPS